MATALLVLIYAAFISLGLPDGLLGSAWPAMQPGFAVPYGFAGIAQMVVSGGTIVSSVLSSRVLRRFGTGRVTAFSVALTALALLGFSLSPSFWWLLLAAVPLGLGAGSVDAGLNAYVAAHYESRHMSWLHCFWGIGALSGPLAISFILGSGRSWRIGYLSIACVQALLVILLVLALPLWERVKARAGASDPSSEASPGAPGEPAGEGPADPAFRQQSLFFPLGIRGVRIALVSFLFYCGIEASMGLWGGSFLFKARGLAPAAAATWVSLFYASITAGRLLTGFITFRARNDDLIRWGGACILGGVALMLLPLPLPFAQAGFILTGLGCAPIFPCMLHETPVRFGAHNSQAVMGFQMAVAYIGSTFLPPLFGFIANATTMALLPAFLAFYALVLVLSSELLRLRLGKAGRSAS